MPSPPPSTLPPPDLRSPNLEAISSEELGEALWQGLIASLDDTPFAGAHPPYGDLPEPFRQALAEAAKPVALLVLRRLGARATVMRGATGLG